MSDLQCPATVILAAGVPAGAETLAGVFDLADVPDGAALRERVDALSDLHRGETICVVAPADLIRAVAGEVPATVEIDSSGWSVRRS